MVGAESNGKEELSGKRWSSRDGAGGTKSIRMGKRKEVNGRVGSTAYEKKGAYKQYAGRRGERGKWRLRSAT